VVSKIVPAYQPESALLARTGRLYHLKDMVGGGHHGTALMVEVKVHASAEILPGKNALEKKIGRPGREIVRGQLFEGVGIHQLELEAPPVAVDGDQAAGAVVGDGAIAAESLGPRPDLGIDAQGPAGCVGVAHVGVVVHIVASIGRHKRVLGDGHVGDGHQLGFQAAADQLLGLGQEETERAVGNRANTAACLASAEATSRQHQRQESKQQHSEQNPPEPPILRPHPPHLQPCQEILAPIGRSGKRLSLRKGGAPRCFQR